MKNILLVLFSFTFFLIASEANAQKLSKSEKKALKKELKAYKKDPAKYAKVKDTQKKEVKTLNDDVTLIKGQLSDAQSDNEELAAKLNLLQAKYNELLSSTTVSEKLPNGTVYQVQMGYYEYLNLQSFNKAMKYVKAEEVEGAKRYIIGYFETVEAALEFRKDIQTLGIKDAFVSQYIDGKRVMDFDATKAN